MEFLTKFIRDYWHSLEPSSWSMRRLLNRTCKNVSLVSTNHGEEESTGEENNWDKFSRCGESVKLVRYKSNLWLEIPGELEADWLSEVGLGEWTQQWRQGKSLPENDIGPAVQKLSLKPHQVKKRKIKFFSRG